MNRIFKTISFLYICLLSSQIIIAQNDSQSSLDSVLEFAGQMPEYPGGIEALNKFINKNVKYPPLAKENKIEGKCFINFIVHSNGSISNIEADTPLLGWGCEREVIRTIERMPDWIPGKEKGKPVTVKYGLPVKFSLNQPCYTYRVLTHLQLAGKDTIYYDQNWEYTTKDSARFCRIVKPLNERVDVTDYFYPSMKKQMTGTYSDTRNNEMKTRDGFFQYYNDSAFITQKGLYKDNLREGIWKYYKPSGVLWYTRSFLQSKDDGEEFTYYENGSIRRKEIYKEGDFKSGLCYTLDGKDTTYYPMEEMPQFPGGMEELYKFLSKKINYPPSARKKGIEGRVYVTFNVEPNGKLNEIEISKSVDELLSAETLRVMNLMPAWIPGRRDGVPVVVKYTLPFKFQLQ